VDDDEIEVGEVSRQHFLRRRRRHVTGGRQARIVVKVTAAEDAKLRQVAEDAGMSVQRLLVASATGRITQQPLPDHAEKVRLWGEAMEVRNLLAALGNNMNQIARNANSTQEIPADFDAAQRAVTAASNRVRDAFGAIYGVQFGRGGDRQ
jgi:hypothetical protein